MDFFNVRDISTRYLLIIADLGQKAEQGELVGDLVRATVRRCMIEMQAAGAETNAVRQILGEMLAECSRKHGVAKIKFNRSLEEARNHMDFLLFLEEKYDHTTPSNPPPVRYAAKQ